MKKIIVFCIALFTTIFGGACAVYTFRSTGVAISPLRIAIFTPTTHNALEEVERGFVCTLKEGGDEPYAFTTFNANGNRSLLRAQAQEIVTGNYDLVFTIGAHCSQTVAQLLQKKQCSMPHVFGAVDSREIAQALYDSNNGTTGAYVHVDYSKQIDALHQLKPEAQNILLVYDPTHGTGLEHERMAIHNHLQKQGKTLHCVEVYQPNEIQQKVSAILPTMDVVLVLIDNTVVAGIDALITLCNRHGITLLASDLSSGKKGAALAYGITEYESGSAAARLAHAIVHEGTEPSALAVTAITKFRMVLNRDTMKAQNALIDASLISPEDQV